MKAVSISKKLLGFIFCGAIFITCSTKKNELSEQEKHDLDSVNKWKQKCAVDSMKKRNPLLILPPDSEYTGSYVDKYKNGIKKFVGFFRQGKRHGQWMSFFPEGNLWSEMQYDKGLRHGMNIVYYPNGKLRYKGFYKNDLQDSIWNYYNEEEKLVKNVWFKNDRVMKQQDF